MDISPIENIKGQLKSMEEYIGLAVAVSTIVIFVGKRIKSGDSAFPEIPSQKDI